MFKNNFLEVGKILNTHGVRGEVKIESLCDTIEDFCEIPKVFIDTDSDPLRISGIRMHKNHILVKFEGVNSVEEAEKLKGKYIYAEKSDIPIKEGHYFIEDLKGCEVYDFDTNERYGILKDVWNAGASDIYTVFGANDKEYYLPIIDGTVKEIDLENSRIVVSPLKGVFDDED